MSGLEFFRHISMMPQPALPMGALVCAMRWWKEDTLAMAAEKNDLIGAAHLIKKGADVNQVDVFGYTPLHKAVQAQQCAMVELLLDQPGIQLEIRDGSHSTAYELAELLFMDAQHEHKWAHENAEPTYVSTTREKMQNCRQIVTKIRLARWRSEYDQVVVAATRDVAPAVAIASDREPIVAEDVAAVIGAPSMGDQQAQEQSAIEVLAPPKVRKTVSFNVS